jgi:hypothetical protein
MKTTKENKRNVQLSKNSTLEYFIIAIPIKKTKPISSLFDREFGQKKASQTTSDLLFIIKTLIIYTFISTSTPLGNSNFIRASTVLAVEL